MINSVGGPFGITLNTGSEIIEPIDNEKLLGGHVSSNLKWNNHIRDNEKSMFKVLTSRVNALSKMSQVSSFKTRKMLAHGMVMSSLIYLIQVWGGTSDYLLKFLQVIQNRAARLVTRLGWYTPTQTLLTQCGWLSIKQLVIFHSLTLVYKIKSDRKPVYLYDKIGHEFSYRTRIADAHGIRQTGRLNSELNKKSFIPRSIVHWNNLPHNIRLTMKLDDFKVKLKEWIRHNIEIV